MPDRQERGSAAVEFALVVPLVLVLALALVQVGLVARDRLLVQAYRGPQMVLPIGWTSRVYEGPGTYGLDTASNQSRKQRTGPRLQ